MVDTGTDRSGCCLALDAKVWPSSESWPQEVIDGFAYLSAWQYVVWDVFAMQEAHAARKLDLVVWYEAGQIVGANVIKLKQCVGGLDMELLCSYGKADGRIRSAYVLERLIALAESKDCQSVSMASPRRIDKLFNRLSKGKRKFVPVETLYRLEINNGQGRQQE